MRWAPNAQTPLSTCSNTAFKHPKDHFREHQRPLSNISKTAFENLEPKSVLTKIFHHSLSSKSEQKERAS